MSGAKVSTQFRARRVAGIRQDSTAIDATSTTIGIGDDHVVLSAKDGEALMRVLHRLDPVLSALNPGKEWDRGLFQSVTLVSTAKVVYEESCNG